MADDDAISKAVQKSTVKNEQIKIAANDPALRGKIHVDDIAPGEPVLWYIKFNLPLDPQTVNKDTMRVMETNGYILASVFSYDAAENLVIISPVDPYLQNEFYILTMTEKVKSAKGNNLKKEIHVLFKLMGNRISEFRILESTAGVPKPRVKPESEKMKTAMTVAKYYSFMDAPGAWHLTKLPIMDMKVNVWLALAGVAALLACLLTNQSALSFVSVASYALFAVGAGHMIHQMSAHQLRSALAYNIGAMFFNAGKQERAAKHFAKAHRLDGANEYAEYALNKVKYYEE